MSDLRQRRAHGDERYRCARRNDGRGRPGCRWSEFRRISEQFYEWRMRGRERTASRGDGDIDLIELRKLWLAVHVDSGVRARGRRSRSQRNRCQRRKLNRSAMTYDRNDFLVEMLHCHRGDVPQFLQNVIMTIGSAFIMRHINLRSIYSIVFTFISAHQKILPSIIPLHLHSPKYLATFYSSHLSL